MGKTRKGNKKQQQNKMEEEGQEIQEILIEENKNSLDFSLSQEEIQNSLKQYQENFSIHKDIEAEKIVKVPGNFDNLYQQMENALIKKTTTNFMIYGLPGFGRKSGVKYSINELNKKYGIKIDMVNINAYTHNNEADFVSELVRQLIKVNKKELNQKTIISDSLNFHVLEKFLEDWDGYCVFQIEQIEELAKSKRQVCLYNFLEWMQASKKNVIMVGISSNLKFQEELEKRVRSRFSSDCVFFFSYELVSILQILMSRFESQNKQMDKLMMEIMKSTEMSKFVDKYIFGTQKPIEWAIQLFKVFLCSIQSDYLKSYMEDENPMVQVTNYAMSYIQRSYNLLIPKREINLMTGLNQTELISIIMIHVLIRRQLTSITLNTVIQEIQGFKQRISINCPEISRVNCSNVLIENAINGLCRLKIIRIEESKLEGLDNKQLILNLSLNDLTQYIEDNKTKWPQFIYQLACE